MSYYTNDWRDWQAKHQKPIQPKQKINFPKLFSSLTPSHSRLSCRRLNNNKIKMLADNLFSSTSNLVRLWVSIGIKQQNFFPHRPHSPIDSYTRWAIIKMRKTHFVEFSVVIKKNQSTLSLSADFRLLFPRNISSLLLFIFRLLLLSLSLYSPNKKKTNITETYPITKSLRLLSEHSRVFHQFEVFSWITIKSPVSKRPHWRIFTSSKFLRSTTTTSRQFHARHSRICRVCEHCVSRIIHLAVIVICHGCRAFFVVHRVLRPTPAAIRRVNWRDKMLPICMIRSSSAPAWQSMRLSSAAVRACARIHVAVQKVLSTVVRRAWRRCPSLCPKTPRRCE